jgi:hypothetical protein
MGSYLVNRGKTDFEHEAAVKFESYIIGINEHTTIRGGLFSG